MKEIKDQNAFSKKIENIKKISKFKREIMGMKMYDFSNNIMMSLFSNRDYMHQLFVIL